MYRPWYNDWCNIFCIILNVYSIQSVIPIYISNIHTYTRVYENLYGKTRVSSVVSEYSRVECKGMGRQYVSD